MRSRKALPEFDRTLGYDRQRVNMEVSRQRRECAVPAKALSKPEPSGDPSARPTPMVDEEALIRTPSPFASSVLRSMYKI